MYLYKAIQTLVDCTHIKSMYNKYGMYYFKNKIKMVKSFYIKNDHW